jgi:DNA-binding IclR family transcriptional regulator
MKFDENKAITVIVKLSRDEYAALQKLANKTGSTIEESAVRSILVDLVKNGFIVESSERGGWKITRLDE